MSAGKQPIYQSQIRGADGKNRGIKIGGGDGSDTGSGPIIRKEGYADLADTAVTLSLAQHFGVLTGTPSAGKAYTTLTGAQISAAYPELEVGDTWQLTIINKAAATHAITLTAGASGVTVRGGSVSAATKKIFTVLKTGANTYLFA